MKRGKLELKDSDTLQDIYNKLTIDGYLKEPLTVDEQVLIYGISKWIRENEVEGGEYYIGYGSYDLKNVVKWLNECFEFCGEAKVSVIDGKDTNVPSNEGWIPVEERLPENSANSIYDMQLVTLKDGEVCLGVYRNKDGEWWTRKQEGETHYKNKHEVIAWQPLPEPYKGTEH